MFSHWKDIDRSFRYIRAVSIALMIFSAVVCLGSLYGSLRYARSQQKKIYVLAGGKILQAFQADSRQNLPVEIRDQIRVFHQDFFSLDPDEQVIQSHLTSALYLADGSAKQLYDNLRESGYYASVIAGNISQRVRIDSIALDLSHYPWYFKCYATQTIIRSTSMTTRSLITQGWIREVSRSDNDPHGLLIERWRVLENQDLKTTSRP
ncbi:MAG TPA: conjugative transposon protein TraK [Chitinophagaceae bacterium]|nr:conjugative transposon protein TraK [Chitinophagaceae bacterium]